jgi:hypothetical protein
VEPIEVTATFDSMGTAHPLRFRWKGSEYQVASSGRRWQDQAGHHIMVMDHQARAYELIFVPSETRWYLNLGNLTRKWALSS